MKILVKSRKSPGRHFLVELIGHELIKRVEHLLDRGKYALAMTTALSDGVMLARVDADDIHRTEADVILTETNAHRDLM
ncbi:MAG: hypothetical protein ABIH74_05970 [Candidatus Omnitrophota bacterium]